MRHIQIILVAAMAAWLTGCVLTGKQGRNTAAIPATPRQVAPPVVPPPPPPSQLSIPQTQVELPPAQPVSDEARKTTEAPGEVAAAPPPVTRPKRPANRDPAATTRTETVGPATPPPAAAPPPVENERPNIQEIISPQEQSRLQAEATKSKREIQQRLDQARRRRLNPQETAIRDEVASYLRLSNEAEKQGDMRKANEFAERGLLRAKDLNGGR